MKTKRVLFLTKYWETTTMEGINPYFMDLKNNYVAQSPHPWCLGSRVNYNRKLIQATKKGTFRGQSFTLPISLKNHYLERREDFERQQIFNLA